jgi:holo-[acyl-carrier protein] synthase
MRWTDVEIVHTASGRPEVRLSGEVAAWARNRGLVDVDVSLSHTAGLAVAQAVSVWDDEGMKDEGSASCVSTSSTASIIVTPGSPSADES